MKNSAQNIKYLIFSITLIVLGLTVSGKAEASQYTYACSDGGTIISDVNISPAGPFSVGNPTSFSVSATVTSASCGIRTVNLTAQNNNGTVYTIIPNSTLSSNGFIPPVIDSIHFSSPASPAGSYAVHFITGVDEPIQIIQNYSYYSPDPNALWGAAFGICQIGYPTELHLTRDEATRLNAIDRGISHVAVSYPIFVDGTRGNTIWGGGIYVRMLKGDFYQDDLEVTGTFEDGLNSSDFNAASYCAGLGGEGYQFSYYFNAQEN